MSDFRELERFIRYHGLGPQRVGRYVGGPMRHWLYRHPERVQLVRGRPPSQTQAPKQGGQALLKKGVERSRTDG